MGLFGHLLGGSKDPPGTFYFVDHGEDEREPFVVRRQLPGQPQDASCKIVFSSTDQTEAADWRDHAQAGAIKDFRYHRKGFEGLKDH